MTEGAQVVLGLTPLAEDALEQALYAPDAAFEIVASVAEADELERVALEREASCVLVSPDLSGLSPSHCARVRALGLRLVGVALDAAGRRQLDPLGLDSVVSPDASPETLAESFRHSVSRNGSNAAAAGTREQAAPELDSSGRGNVLAVVGGKGAPGASECAASLAALAAQRWATVLVELDGAGGGLDLRLNADPRGGSLIAAVRAGGADRAAAELLERWLVRRAGWPPVLLGPPEPERLLHELTEPGAIRRLLAAMTRSFALVVCDTGWQLGGGGAAQVHREAVVAADAVLLVLGARDEQLRSGLAQLDRLLTELEIPAERIRIALNGAGAPGTIAKSAVLETVQRQLAERGLTLDATLPWDERALARSVRKALPLGSVRGGYRRALARLLDELFLPTAPAPRRRKLKLAVPVKPAHDEEVPLPWRS